MVSAGMAASFNQWCVRGIAVQSINQWFFQVWLHISIQHRDWYPVSINQLINPSLNHQSMVSAGMAASFKPNSCAVSYIINQSIAIIHLSRYEYGCILQPIIMRGILYQSINQTIFNLSRHACKLQVNIMRGILYQSIN